MSERRSGDGQHNEAQPAGEDELGGFSSIINVYTQLASESAARRIKAEVDSKERRVRIIESVVDWSTRLEQEHLPEVHRSSFNLTDRFVPGGVLLREPCIFEEEGVSRHVIITPGGVYAIRDSLQKKGLRRSAQFEPGKVTQKLQTLFDFLENSESFSTRRSPNVSAAIREHSNGSRLRLRAPLLRSTKVDFVGRLGSSLGSEYILEVNPFRTMITTKYYHRPPIQDNWGLNKACLEDLTFSPRVGEIVSAAITASLRPVHDAIEEKNRRLDDAIVVDESYSSAEALLRGLDE